jgi:AraC-like DNA-binding protein
LPATELVDQQVRLADLPLGGPARRAVEQAEEHLSAYGARVEALEALAEDLGSARIATRFADVVAHRAAAGARVEEIADELGLGTRQLHRRCLAAFGYGPKLLGRVLRLQQALALGRDGRPGAEAAAVAGFADQAHLARDLRALAGSTWTDLVRR